MNTGTKVFLVLLRVAIGWHFFYEGIYKIASDRAGAQPFTAEHYLRSAKGPAADFFQSMIRDSDGLNRLTKGAATLALDERCQQLIDFYDLADELTVPATNGASGDGSTRVVQANQVTVLRARRDELQQVVEARLDDPQFQRQLADYELMLSEYRENARNLSAPYSTERLLADEAKLNQTRNELLTVVTEPLEQLDRTARSLRVRLSDDFDQMRLGAPPRLASQTPWLDVLTAWGLAIVGFCLIVGLFPRLACLGAAGFLVMFYLSWPPWPGVPEAPVSEGHYVIVNKNLIELIAVLVLMTVPTGRWGGLHAFVGYFVLDPLRRREAGAPATDERIVERLGDAQPANEPRPEGLNL